LYSFFFGSKKQEEELSCVAALLLYLEVDGYTFAKATDAGPEEGGR